MLAVFRKRNTEIGIARFFGVTSWTFTLLGLVTGMFWAQVAWGSYWSWDPKETLTLTLFVTLSAALTSSFEQRRRLTKWLSLLACILSVVTALTSFITAGLHSFL
jgi:ABC-type transport system involved in cytochrome c biogenesis permease subunit